MTALLTSHQAALANLVGVDHLRPHEQHLHVAPADTQEIAAVLKYANAQGLSVIPTGGGTKLGWGNHVEPQLVLDMHRMNAVLDHPWQDMTCTVQAGCTWAAMQAALSKHNQHVALDPLWADDATIGGIIATNDSGALRFKYGSLRDLIIGMTIVLADGTIAKTGGKVVKNVAGYDLHKLMTGAFGTLGVIAEVNFRLHPMEKDLQTWSIATSDAYSLDKPLRALLDSQLDPVSAQVRCEAKSAALDVRLASPAGQKSAQHLALEQIADGHSLTRADDKLWNERERLAGALEHHDADIERAVLKVSLPHDEICNFLARVQHLPHDVSAQAVAQAHGLALVTLDGSLGALARIVRTLGPEIAELGGSHFIQTAPQALRESIGLIDLWGGGPPAGIALMREIKRQFDPNRTLNPGRFVGGI